MNTRSIPTNFPNSLNWRLDKCQDFGIMWDKMGQSGASHLRFAQSGSNVGQTEQVNWLEK